MRRGHGSSCLTTASESWERVYERYHQQPPARQQQVMRRFQRYQGMPLEPRQKGRAELGALAELDA